MNSLPRCQKSTIYAAFRWVTPSTYISSLNEIPGGHEREEAIEQMVRELEPDCPALLWAPRVPSWVISGKLFKLSEVDLLVPRMRVITVNTS